MIPLKMPQTAINMHRKAMLADAHRRLSYLLEAIAACESSRAATVSGYRREEKSSLIHLARLWVKSPDANRPLRSSDFGSRMNPALILATAYELAILKDFFSNLPDILLGSPSTLNALHQDFSNRHNKCYLNITSNRKLMETLEKVLRYEEFSSPTGIDGWSGKMLCKELEISACPYCNRSYIHVVHSAQDWRPQLDHFLPKSQYPLFRASLFNLIPVCGQCNWVKGDSVVPSQRLNPYLSDKSSIKFFLDAKVINFTSCQDSATVRILNPDRTALSSDANDFYSRIGVLAAYEHHGRDAADVVNGWIQFESNQTLEQQFRIPKEFLQRILIGDELGVLPHKQRVLSKMKRDIAEQIGLASALHSLS